MKHSNISIFIPHLGCPFNCIFCNQFKITGSDSVVTPRDVYRLLNETIHSDKNDKNNTQIAFFGGSFTAIDKNLMIEYLETANNFIGNGMFESIRISTRPDCINEDILTILKKYNVKTIELGIQSLDNTVLEKSKRGHTAEQSLRSCEMIKKNGFELAMQMMCGLPGDTFEKDIYTAKRIIDVGCKQVRIYPVVVIDGTYLAKMYFNGEYSPLKTEDAVDICATLYQLFIDNNVKVLKIGIHSDSNSIAGPFHPAFGELVRSKVFYNKLLKKIEKNKPYDILIAPNFISIAKGNAKSNISLLQTNGYNVNFLTDESVKYGEFVIK